MKNSTKETEIGLIPEEWEVMSFNEICTLQRGFDLPQAQREKGVHPLVSASGISDHISEYKVSAPGVVTGRSGTLGQSFFITENFWPLNTTLWVKDFKGNDPYFIYVLLGSLNLEDFNAGSGVPTLNRNHLDQIKVSLPSIEEQRQIASILSSLDDKIELNRQINTNLEKMASALFKRWFIDFEFPDENRRPYKSSGGKMVETEMGEVPEGWRVSCIGNEVRVVGGGTPSTAIPEYWDGDIYWATPKDLSNLVDSIILKTDSRITKDGLTQISSGLLPAGTVLLSSRAPIGYLAIAEIPIAINQGFIAMICEGVLSKHYTRLWVKRNMEIIKGYANGSTFLEVNKVNFRTLPVIVPEPQTLENFDLQMESIHQRVLNSLKETQALISVRDSLKPRLMSGKIRSTL